MAGLRMRRVEGRWPVRRRYEVELRDEAGQLTAASRTAAPSAFLVRRARVHSTDSWDWIRAADEAFERGSTDWVTAPFEASPSLAEDVCDTCGHDWYLHRGGNPYTNVCGACISEEDRDQRRYEDMCVRPYPYAEE